MLLATLFSAPENERLADSVHRLIVSSLWPELLREPVNPQPAVGRIAKWMLKKITRSSS
jgi:hypothetical protein